MKVKDQLITNRYALYNADCIEVMKGLPSETIGLSIFSPPFADLYSYSDDISDMGNNSYPDFFKHFSFLVKELGRVLLPGRIVAVHCMDIPSFKKNGEEIGLKDFSGDIIRCFLNFGFIYHSRHCIWKDPLVAAVRTKAIGLAHKQIVKDSSLCRTGIPDYILAFRKPGENPKPIKNEDGLTHYHGKREIPSDFDSFLKSKVIPAKNKRSHWIWQQYASPVWFDIRQTKVLSFKSVKEQDDEKHICPLQMDVIERCVALWSAPKDVVLTPFMGIGSEIYVAVKNGRKGIGIELKRSYFKQAVRNLESLTSSIRIGKVI